LSKNVAVFVDVANIFYAAKAAGVDIDYVTLLRSAGAGRDLVRAYAYTGLDPENENQRNFHDFLRRHGYKVVSKDIRKYGDGKVKANLDIELVVDMMKTARNLDIAIVVSGDGDFAPAIRAVQEMGVRVEVISFRGNTSSDLIDVADQFTDITQLARVEKGTRSGRRVAGDDADLSMTEVPDKQTEGSGTGRGGRTRSGRGRGRTTEAEPAVAATSRPSRRGRAATNGTRASTDAEALVALPGERLAKAGGRFDEADLAAAEVFTIDDMDEGVGSEGTDDGERESLEQRDEAGRRRRRRGGRGRGRGRGREETAVPVSDRPARASERFERDNEDEDAEEPIEAPRPRSTPFGSVWDSQLGTPAARLGPIAEDDDDFEEPEIPEYLIAEQRQGNRGRGGGGRGPARGGPRGGRSAYQSAIARERFGRGGSGGINRYPDVSGRTAPARGPREERGYGRSEERQREVGSRSSSAEPWSEVPPELEAMLRAQVTPRQGGRPTEVAPPALTPSAIDDEGVGTAEAMAAPTARAEGPAEAQATKRRSTRSTAAKGAKASATATTKRRATRKAAPAEAATGVEAEATDAAEAASATAAPKRRSTRKASTSSDEATAGSDAPTATKRRTTRKAASTATDSD
jgi:uncharacterized LabA/DUF88 family protein